MAREVLRRQSPGEARGAEQDDVVGAVRSHAGSICGSGGPGCPPRRSGRTLAVDRRLANRNLRTGLIAGALIMIVFAASFVVAFVY